MVLKCRNIAAFKFWWGNITIWSRKISWFFERYQNHRSWEYFSRIFFFNFRKSREIILKDILKSSFYIFIKIRSCLILEEFRKYQYKSWIYSKNSRECVWIDLCDKCDNILLTEITWANTWRGVLDRAYIPLLHTYSWTMIWDSECSVEWTLNSNLMSLKYLMLSTSIALAYTA